MGIEDKRLYIIGLAMEKFCHGKGSRDNCHWVSDISSWPAFEPTEDSVTISFKNRDDRQFFLDCREFQGKYVCDMRIAHKFLFGSGGILFGCAGNPSNGNDISFDSYDDYVEMDAFTDQMSPSDTDDTQDLPHRPDIKLDTHHEDSFDITEETDSGRDIHEIDDADIDILPDDISELDMSIPPDGCDVEDSSEVDAKQPDLDKDGVGDEEDNCPNVANSLQKDSDENGIGDACDPSMLEVLSKILAADMDAYNDKLVIYGANASGKPVLMECQIAAGGISCSSQIEIPVSQTPLFPQSYIPTEHGGLALAMGETGTPTAMGRFDRGATPAVQSFQFSETPLGDGGALSPTYATGFARSPSLIGDTIFMSHFYCSPSPEDPCESPSLLVGYRDHPDWSQSQFKMTHLIPETFDGIPDMMDVSRRSAAMAHAHIESHGCKTSDPCDLLLVMSAGDNGQMAGIGLHPASDSAMMMKEWIGFTGPDEDVEAHHVPELNMINSGTIAVVPMARPHHSLKFVDVTSASAPQQEISLEDAVPAEAKITDISFDQAAADNTSQNSLDVYLTAGDRLIRVKLNKVDFTSEKIECAKIAYGAAKVAASSSWLFVGTADGRVLKLDPDDPDLFGNCQ